MHDIKRSRPTDPQINLSQALMSLGTSMPSLLEALTPPYLSGLKLVIGPLKASVQASMVLSFLAECG